ncbi:hypothetical protein C0J52_18394 [Blattella germanica]|nr:hypothetical protein C0J52_18394 [Blattella germanica]
MQLNERGVRRILEGKSEGKLPVGRPRMKWENNINHDLREDRDVWRVYVRTAMNLRVRYCQLVRPPWINDDDDYDGQMMSGDRLGLKFPDICLMGEEKPQKNLTQETCPDRESNPGPLRERRIRYPLLHNVKQVNDVYGKPDIIRKIISHRLRWAGHPVGRPTMKWENNINHDMRKVDYTGDHWKTLAQDRDVWRAYVCTAINIWVRYCQ